ncbi:outer membrane protein assembly factor BamA [Verrucomicrobiales bacterium]|nr:outer membrane protein assembly factor BamA [Verrucomicrobiales bacterium]MDB4657586.1 outer membrane protein assembly factor BamA [Verrucomicrobiales bacterium]MDC0292119.1 outer membrane protein assembly factor BamA [Verrucomicrobiales bacterium]MDC0311955.1 outer membrane protein assembly factor BamA [bacterium]
MNHHSSVSIKTVFFRGLSSAIAALVLLAASTSAQEGKTVKSIDVQYVGAQAVSADQIKARMSTRVGSTLSAAKIDDDVKNLYSSGLVENVRMLSKPVGGGIGLIVVVQTRALYGGVAFEGNTLFSNDKLEKKIDLKVNSPIDEATVQEGRTAIQEMYRKKGFPEATISYQVSAPNADGYSIVTFKINEGGRGILRSVEFVGNTVFSGSELRKAMEQKAKGFLPFGKKGRTDADSLQGDVSRIERLYLDEGYLNARVVNVSKVQVDTDSVDVIMTIDEGQAYTVAGVSILGIDSLSLGSDIQPYLTMTAGNVFSGSDLESDVKLIEDQYGMRGYVEARVSRQFQDAGPGQVNIVLQVFEGKAYRVGQIDIEGNNKTKDIVIRREIALLPGENFDTVALDATRARLQNMNYFSDVEVIPLDTSYLDEKDLLIRVTEKPTGTINFGAGFSSIDDLVGFVEVTQTNFDIGNWPSLTGGGQRFRMSLRAGTKRRDFQMSLTEPWFMGKRLALTGEVFYRDLLFLSDQYDQTQYGGDINFRKSLGEFTYGVVGYRPEMYEIDVEPGASELFQNEAGDFFKSTIGVDLVYDTRDNLFMPREGHRASFGVDYAGLGGDVDDLAYSLSVAKHVELPFDIILNGSAKYQKSDGDNIFTRQFLGGANNLRGFDFRDVGPKDPDSLEGVGGDEAWNATLEATFPLVTKIRGAVFYDVGEVSGGPDGTIGGGVNSDYGIGLRLFLLGAAPVRLDYGIPLESDAYNDGSGRFNFTIGAQF